MHEHAIYNPNTTSAQEEKPMEATETAEIQETDLEKIIRDIIAAEDPDEALKSKIIDGEISADLYDELQLGMSVALEWLPLEEAAEMLNGYVDQEKISQETYDLFLGVMLDQDNEQETEAKNTTKHAAETREAEASTPKTLKEFVQVAMNFSQEQKQLDERKMQLAAMTNAEEDLKARIVLASLNGLMDADTAATLLRKRKTETLQQGLDAALEKERDEIAALEKERAAFPAKMRIAFFQHPEFRANRTALQAAVLQKAFEPAQAQRVVPARIEAVGVLLGGYAAKLTSSLFTLSKTLYHRTGYRMGGRFGPQPHIKNITTVRNQARAMAPSLALDDPIQQEFQEAMRAVERFLLNQKRMDPELQQLKREILHDWRIDHAAYEFEKLAQDLGEYYEMLPDLMAEQETAYREKIKQKLGVEKVDERTKVLYEMGQSLQTEEQKLGKLLESTLADNHIFHEGDPHGALGRMIGIGELMNHTRAAMDRVRTGEASLDEAALPVLIAFSDNEMKAQAFDLKANSLEDEADGILEEISRQVEHGLGRQAKKKEKRDTEEEATTTSSMRSAITDEEKEIRRFLRRIPSELLKKVPGNVRRQVITNLRKAAEYRYLAETLRSDSDDTNKENFFEDDENPFGTDIEQSETYNEKTAS